MLTMGATFSICMYLLTVLLSILFDKLPGRKVVTLSPRLFWTRLDLQLYPFLFTLNIFCASKLEKMHVTHGYPLLMTVLSLKYNLSPFKICIPGWPKYILFFFIYLTNERALFEQAITTYLCKLESWDSIQTNEMHVIVILLTRHLNTKYQLIIQALF